MRRILNFLPILLVAGCATPKVPEPQVVTVQVPVPTEAPCVPKGLTLKAPGTKAETDTDYPDTDAALKAAPGAAERYQLLYGGRLKRNARLNEVEPVVAACPKEK